MSIQDLDFPYSPPCMMCQPIIDYTNVSFHDPSIVTPLTLFEDPEYNFGTFNVAIRGEIPIISKHLHVFFNIDASGSMNDMCVDNRSKMQHILFTLENILRIFHEKSMCNISCHVQSFDSIIHHILQGVDDIKTHDIESIVTQIKQIRPGNSTNIEQALQSAKEQIAVYRQSNLETEIVHIFLTDGEITSGSKDKQLLKTLVPKDCTNIFIGYGLEHDSLLLSFLSDELGNEYRFIDALERAGLVYGEIVYSILYRAIADVTIKAHNSEIYNYKTNEWLSYLNIGYLLGEQQKTYHLRSKKPKEAIVYLLGKTIIKTRQFQIITDAIEEQSSTCHIYETDLTKYMFRQKTQELLYETKTISEKPKDLGFMILFSEDKKEMKTKLKTFMQLMLKYMKDHNIESEPFMKMLCDDIFIAHKTFDTSLANMYTSARQKSQGCQQTYTISTNDKSEPKINIMPTDEELLAKFDLDELPPVLPRLGFRQHNNWVQYDDDENEEDEEDDVIAYTLEHTIISPYSTQGVINIMREVSGDATLSMTQKL